MRDLKNWRNFFDIEGKRKDISKLEDKMNSPDFWSSNESKIVLKRLKVLKNLLEKYELLKKDLEYLKELSEIVEEDMEFLDEYQREFLRVKKLVDDFEVYILFDEEDDIKNAILNIHPGAGGTESHDWAEMLLRMYIKWFEKKGFKYKIVNLLKGEEAGIKDVTIFVEGEYAYGFLKAERGIHRLVRISPFDANRRRHTSFASVFVYPEVEDVQVEIKEDDLEIQTFRASGPGGQHVQMAATAIRIKHIPTGIVVSCQSERSLSQNREIAMKLLKAKLYEYYKQKQKEKLKDIEKEKKEIAWGNQIRSYILHPYKLVKDHRTGYETSNAEAVLDGEIDDFIKEYLFWRFKNKNESSNSKGK